MMSALRTTLLIASSLLAGAAGAASCDFLPEAPQPGWTTQPPTIAGRYAGVGVAERARKSDFAQLRELSRQAALRDLAQGIEVSVRSALSVEVTSRSGTAGELTQQDVKQITETTTEVALKDVTADEQWLDRKRCMLWTLVSVPNAVVATARELALQRRQLARVQEGIAAAEDPARSFDARLQGADTADALLERIDFRLLAGEADRGALRTRIDGIRAPLRAQRANREKVRTLQGEAESLLARASAEPNLTSRRRLAADAAAKLKEALRLLPVGTPGASEPDALALRLADLERERGNSCAAKRGYERVAEASLDAAARTRAAGAAAAIACTDEDEETYAWRKLFDGRGVTLRCAVRASGTARAWDSACSRAATFLQGSGAVVVNGNGLGTPAQVVEAAKRLAADPSAVPDSDAEWLLLLVADGQLNQRPSPQAAGRQDYQFEGGAYAFVVGAGATEFSDAFQGVGGWNPVSGAMAVDVLGIHLIDRWKSKYLEATRGNLQ
jgi:hypothetical protein